MADFPSTQSFTLSKTLSTADSEPVRSLAVINTNQFGNEDENAEYQFLAGSQNGIISIYTLNTTSNQCNKMIPNDGSNPHSMTALLNIPLENFGYACGSRDSHIRIYSDDHMLMNTLTGHDKPVTSLSWLDINKENQYLVSGSWDGTAKIWNLNSSTCMATLPNHENTVTVLGLNKTGKVGNSIQLVTASAGVAEGGRIMNHKIRIWHVEAVAKTLKCTLDQTPNDNHSGPIRGLTYDENAASNVFISCSNDGTLKFRDVKNGECMQTISVDENSGQQQPPILLDITTLSTENDNYVAIAVEDGTLAIWSQKTGSIQRISHPGCVWKILALPNGDICSACQDGYVRIFTCDPSRFANEDDILTFEQAVLDTQRKASTGPSAEEIAKLPKWEMRSIQTGRSEGQVQVFSKDGKAIAAQWNDASKTWIEVGEVMGSNQNTGSIDGVQYDHVLPIEIDMVGGGVQKLQIGYNNGENPFVTAQNFIDQYMLDQNYLSQIADYIRQRVGDSSITLGAENSTSGKSSSSTTFGISHAPKQQKIYQHIPMKGYLVFDTADLAKTIPKMMKKIEDTNAENGGKIDLSPLNTLRSTLLETSRYHSSTIDLDELRILKKCLFEWDIDAIFPVLDLTRITVLHPDAGGRGKEGLWLEIVQIVLDKCSQITHENASSSKLITAVPFLSLRIFSNCFRGGKGAIDAVSSNLLMILSNVEKFSKLNLSNKNLRLSITTLILNIASFMNISSSVVESHQKQFILQISSICKIILTSDNYEDEALTRTLLTIGTILFMDKTKILLQELNLMEFSEKISKIGGKGALVWEEVSSMIG